LAKQKVGEQCIINFAFANTISVTKSVVNCLLIWSV
jgi:hypothetical protein